MFYGKKRRPPRAGPAALRRSGRLLLTLGGTGASFGPREIARDVEVGILVAIGDLLHVDAHRAGLAIGGGVDRRHLELDVADDFQEADVERISGRRRRAEEQLADAAAVVHGGAVRRQHHAVPAALRDRPRLAPPRRAGEDHGQHRLLEPGPAVLLIVVDVDLGGVDPGPHAREAAAAVGRLLDATDELDAVAEAVPGPVVPGEEPPRLALAQGLQVHLFPALVDHDLEARLLGVVGVHGPEL